VSNSSHRPAIIVQAAGWLALAVMVAWGTLAVAYSNLPVAARWPAAIVFVLTSGALLCVVPSRTQGRWAFAALFSAVLGWWLLIPPSNNRDWQPDLAVLPYADIEGSKITLHNIRNCEYRTETDFDVRHYDAVLDLNRLETVDLSLVYWGSPNIAHTMTSFGFSSGEVVCCSIETRKERGEGYSAIKGLFRQYELTYVMADERDLVRLRTNFRTGEDVYLYRLRMTNEQCRVLFLDYLRRANRLRAQPEWYNAATSNCTTAIRAQRAPSDRAAWNWRMLFNGHLDTLLYERGMLANALPFAELKARSLINPVARAAGNSADFSRLIRQGLPPLTP
jgi:hypothetical protein